MAGQVYCLSYQVGRSSAWVHSDQPAALVCRDGPGAWVIGLLLKSVVMGLGPQSLWADLDSRSPRANQVLGTPGMGSASRYTEAGLVLGQVMSLPGG